MAQKFTVPVTIKNLSSAGSDGLTVFLDQESFARLKVEAGGRITWGDGSGAGDTNLYRDAASVLKTDDTFKAAGLFVSGTEIDTVGATTGDALVFNGTKFVSASVAAGGGASLTVSDTPPEDAEEGDLWFSSLELEVYVYYSSAWIQVTDSSSGVQELYELVDVLIDNPVPGETLVYNGTEWENGFVSAGAAVSLETARIIQLSGDVSGSVLFDGSQDVNIATTVLGAGSVTLGTNTSGSYVESLVAGTGVTLTNNSGESATPTVAIGQEVGTSASVTFAKVSSDVTGDLTGNADTATALETARLISLGGDLSGSVSFDGTSNVTITATVQPDSVALGTNTTGNYVNDVTAGTGVTVTHTPGEGSSPTIAIGQAVDTSSSVTFANVSADLVGDVTGNLTGDVTGNADTATALQTARTISIGGDVSGSVSFNGTTDVTISAVIQPDSVALGTDTSGDYVSSLVAGIGVTLTNNSGETATPTIAIGQDVATSASVTFSHVSAPVTGNVIGDLTGNADTATALETARTIELSGDVSGSASFDGTSNINIFTTVNTASVALDELYGVSIVPPVAEYQVLQHNGTVWTNDYPDTVSYVRNVDSVTLTPGMVVYIFGGNGDHATVKRADNSSDVTSSKTLGVVAATITAGNNGPVVTRGYVDSIDLSPGYTEGQVLWLGKNGAFTTTKPSAPDHLVYIGVVVRATNNGIVYAACQNGYELEELHNVKINGVTDGQFLRYNSASTMWVNDTINLGTDTAGDYVQNLNAGTGVTLSNNSGEGATPTVAIGQDVATSASVTFARLIVQGDMEVQGTITRLNEANLDVDTAFIYLNANSASANPDMGIAFNYDDGTYRHAGLFRDSSDGIFKVFEGYEPEPVSPINTSDATYSDARFQAESLILTQTTGIAPMSVSSSTVVTNLNADKLDGQDGSYYAPIDSPTFTGTVSLPNNTVALGTQTTGNYVSDVSGGTGVNVTHTPGEGTTPSIAIGQDVATSASVTFAAVTAPLIGNVTGNADTATALAASRTIELTGDVTGSVSFNGSANASITATIAANSVALGTDTTGNYMSGLSAGTGISVSHTPGEGSSASISLNATLDDLSNVTAPSPSTNQYLRWNGTAWVNSALVSDSNQNFAAGTDTLISGSLSGSYNTGVGSYVMGINTTGFDNTAVGYQSGMLLTTGSANTFVGKVSGNAVSTGIRNTAVGHGALANTTTGSSNTAVGREAGLNANGGNSVFIGAQAGDSTTTGTNVIVIGTGSDASSASVSNEITLGNSSITKFRIPGLNLEATSGTITTSSGNLTINSVGGTVTIDDDLIISGGLTVSGTTTTVNTETINLADNIITLNSNETSTPSQNAGIEVERGTSANVALRWNETSDKWEITEDGSTYNEIATALDISNGAIAVLDDIGDVSAGSPETGQFLQWNGVAWVSANVPGNPSDDASAILATQIFG